MELMETILARRSGRIYTGAPVSPEALRSILQAGLLSPSGRNRKPVELLTVSGPEQMQQLASVKAAGSSMLKTADCAVIVLGNTSLTDTWIEDGSIAMTQMMLRATDLGIANCWVQIHKRESSQSGISAESYARRLLNIPEHYGVLAILSLGIAAQPADPHTLQEADFSKVHTDQF